MITVKIEDLTIKQIMSICEEHRSCTGCSIKKYCDTNFMKEPRYFNDNSTIDGEYKVDVEIVG